MLLGAGLIGMAGAVATKVLVDIGGGSTMFSGAGVGVVVVVISSALETVGMVGSLSCMFATGSVVSTPFIGVDVVVSILRLLIL